MIGQDELPASDRQTSPFPQGARVDLLEAVEQFHPQQIVGERQISGTNNLKNRAGGVRDEVGTREDRGKRVRRVDVLEDQPRRLALRLRDLCRRYGRS